MNKKTIILVAILVLVVVSAIYFFMNQGDSTPTTLNKTGTPALKGQVVPSDADSVVGQKFLATLLKMQDLNLDRAILQDVVFLALKDMSRPLPDQTPGRPNPFSPLDTTGIVNNTGLTTQADTNIQSSSASVVSSVVPPQTTKTQNTNTLNSSSQTKNVTTPKSTVSNQTSGSNSNKNNSSNVQTQAGGGGFVSP